MANEIHDILKSQMANGRKLSSSRPSPEQVDELADRLVEELHNPTARRWYCGVIYKFGYLRVEIWLARAKEGNLPAALFTHYVNAAGGYSRGKDGK